jgi:hypothetical protein
MCITFVKYSLLFLNQISFQIYIYTKHHCTTVQSLQILEQQQQNYPVLRDLRHYKMSKLVVIAPLIRPLFQ